MSLLSRRRFVKTFAVFSAAATVPRKRWRATVLAEVQPQSQMDAGVLRLRLSDFPPLQQEFGSVRLGTSPVGPDHHPVGLFYPLLINRGPNGQFFALDSECTHEGCTVPTFDPAIQGMQCPCHGSQYSIDGRVRRGPAHFPLRSFQVQYDGANGLAVKLPDLSFGLQATAVQPGSGRLHLQFIAFDQLEYELRFRPNTQADWSGPVPFSLTPAGPADQMSLLGHANYANLHLDRTGAAGFYAVVMRVKVV